MRVTEQDLKGMLFTHDGGSYDRSGRVKPDILLITDAKREIGPVSEEGFNFTYHLVRSNGVLESDPVRTLISPEKWLEKMHAVGWKRIA